MTIGPSAAAWVREALVLGRETVASVTEAVVVLALAVGLLVLGSLVAFGVAFGFWTLVLFMTGG